ncbi:DUF3040 domain-containing protein [Paenarthrobacter nitroguajacolicus]|uniref:DUF3040 domain-containing protein n=1 Tax=Paenarthrobacter nitroguajacolicus TaxID=211146 RepID=UPI00248CC189|nr:DUF3040 domain-containing protein [Paenarthrobacter nitroguajacolicus]MDI2036939.1 hypothetical protein [Paenarthrobacter nitroguajacolicus]
MPLSERERRVLEQLERELFIQDPDLARQLESGVPVRTPVHPRIRDVIAAAAGVLLVLLAIPLHVIPFALAGILLVVHAVFSHRNYKKQAPSRLL